MSAKPNLILASSSPRRRELLPLLGFTFEVIAPQVTELDAGDPVEVVLANAERKARAVADMAPPGSMVLGCDTDVVLDGEVLGKPESVDAARRRLRALAGRTHEVHSGVFVAAPAGERRGSARTLVSFRELDEDEIEAYVATGEWRGRAGGYAVQGFGSSLVREISGDLSNVIGLPLPLVAALMAEVQAG